MQWTRTLGAPIVPAWIIALVFVALLGATPTRPEAATPFAVEYYYKVQWGHFDEFLALYKKNHYPILVKLQEMGRIVDMRADRPFNHASEAARWDFRFTIVWKDAATAHDLDFDDDPIIAALYPDRETFVKEEQRRFELLIEHMDVPVVSYDLSTW